MVRLSRCVVPFVVVASASVASADQKDTPVTFELKSLESVHLKGKLEEGDSLTGKAQLKLRYYRESAWLFEQDVDLVANTSNPKRLKYSLAKLEKPVKLDPEKQIECHMILPSAKGKTLVAVEAKKPTKPLGSKPMNLSCSTLGNQFVLVDGAEYKWLDIGTATPINLSYRITFDKAITSAMGKAKDEAQKTGDELVVAVELFNPETKSLVSTRSVALGSGTKVVGGFGFNTTADRGDTLEAPEGKPLAFRLTIPTAKGGALVAEGDATPWRTAAVNPRSNLFVDATFRYEAKAPKVGEWTDKAMPAKAATPVKPATATKGATPVKAATPLKKAPAKP